MALNVTSLGDNPSYPYQSSETYIPDQLIAGNLKLVTDTALIGGSAALARGTLLTMTGVGAIASSAGKTPATGTITVAAVPAAGDTLTVFGTVITFVAANPVGNQVMIGGADLGGNPPAVPTIAGTVTALADFLAGSTDANLIKGTYSVAGAVITATAAVVGTAGNALTLATSNAVAFTLSAATLTGGTANTGAETIGTISAGAAVKAGAYTITLTSATAATVEDPTGLLIGNAVVGTQFVDPQISFLITTGAGIAAGDVFSLRAALGSGVYVPASGASAFDAANPPAVLAGFTDATLGNVLGPIYLMGEFNVNAMIFGPGVSIPAAKNALRRFGIFLKTAVTMADPA